MTTSEPFLSPCFRRWKRVGSRQQVRRGSKPVPWAFQGGIVIYSSGWRTLHVAGAKKFNSFSQSPVFGTHTSSIIRLNKAWADKGICTPWVKPPISVRGASRLGCRGPRIGSPWPTSTIPFWRSSAWWTCWSFCQTSINNDESTGYALLPRGAERTASWEQKRNQHPHVPCHPVQAHSAARSMTMGGAWWYYYAFQIRCSLPDMAPDLDSNRSKSCEHHRSFSIIVEVP